MSQLDLALEADISQRHLSFVESGRSRPSREMVLKLARHMGVPLRHANRLLLAAGFAPVFNERRLDDPSMAGAMDAVRAVLAGHEPFPALVIDRHWNMVAANNAVGPLLEGLEEPELLRAPINVLRLTLHPGGLAPHIVNLSEWRRHIIERLRLQIDVVTDRALVALERELVAYPGGQGLPIKPFEGSVPVAVPLRLRVGARTFSFISTTTVFGAPLDITLSELAIESFFPADAQTREALQGSQ